MIKKILLNICLLLMANFALATIQASIDRSTIELGQSLNLTITLQSSGDNPNLDNLNENFEIYGTSSSSQISIINGNSSSQFSYKITLMPKNPGKQMIPSIKIGSDATRPIPIEVLKSSERSQDLHSKAKIYLDVTTEKKPYLYVGVPVLLSLKIYYQVSINNIRMEPLNIPNAKIEIQGKVTQYKDNAPGSNYQVIEQKYLITPQVTGNITIPSIKISGVSIPDQSQNIFMMMNGQPFMLNSKPIVLKVRPIPPGINPDAWLPATKLNVIESWTQESDPLTVGQIIKHKVVIDAIGISSSSIPNITFTAPYGVNSYPDKPLSDDNTSNGQLFASKTFNTVYVPTKAEKIEFPSTSIQWWDINTNQLKTIVIPAKAFNIKSDGNKLTNINRPGLLNSSQVVSNKTSKIIIPVNNIKYYYFIIALLIITIILIILFFVLRRKNGHPNFAVTQKLGATSEKVLFNMLIKALKKKDINATNLALIAWAGQHCKKNIYTISDIKDLSSNLVFTRLLDKLNLTIYRGETFDDYDLLETELIKIHTLKVNKSKTLLKSFYPE